MSQADPGAFVDTEGGTAHVSRHNSVAAASLSSHAGTSRPSYAVDGTIWLDTNTPSAAINALNIYDGTDDILIGNVNTTSNVFGVTDMWDADFDTGIQVEEGADDDIVRIDVGGAEVVHVAGANVYLGDTANANMAVGITVNQGANDDEILAFKSSDIAHGYTTGSETDTYFTIAKESATTGGVRIVGYGETIHTEPAIRFIGYGNATGLTTKTNADFSASMELNFYGHNGSNALSNSGSNCNVWSISVYRGGAQAYLWGIDEDGDYFYDGADGGAFDVRIDPATGTAIPWDDMAMLRAVDLWRAAEYPDIVGPQVRPSRFDGNRYLKDDLGNKGYGGAGLISQVVSTEDWENGARALLSGPTHDHVVRGALWQNHEMMDAEIDTQEEVWSDLEAALAAAGVTISLGSYKARLLSHYTERGLPTQILDWDDPVPITA